VPLALGRVALVGPDPAYKRGDECRTARPGAASTLSNPGSRWPVTGDSFFSHQMVSGSVHLLPGFAWLREQVKLRPGPLESLRLQAREIALFSFPAQLAVSAKRMVGRHHHPNGPPQPPSFISTATAPAGRSLAPVSPHRSMNELAAGLVFGPSWDHRRQPSLNAGLAWMWPPRLDCWFFPGQHRDHCRHLKSRWRRCAPLDQLRPGSERPLGNRAGHLRPPPPPPNTWPPTPTHWTPSPPACHE